jgi:hypothetical protein
MKGARINIKKNPRAAQFLPRPPRLAKRAHAAVRLELGAQQGPRDGGCGGVGGVSAAGVALELHLCATLG